MKKTRASTNRPAALQPESLPSPPDGQNLEWAQAGSSPVELLRHPRWADQGRAAAKRLYDLAFAGLGLLLVSPLFVVLGCLIKLTDGGPIFYRQVRIGLHGRPFRIWKFRTMVPQADRLGPAVTRDGDQRITRIGRFLRRTKLDELPQLWNVFKGEMSLVGPRPEVPKYVEQYTPQQRAILEFKPGITDLATICFRGEEALLRHTDNLEAFYVEQCIPRKLKLNREYAERANLISDTWIILQTVCPYWVGLLVVYGSMLLFSFWLSCLLIYDFSLPPVEVRDLSRQLLVVVGLQLCCLVWRDQCRGLLSYFSFPELREITTALSFAGCLLLGFALVGQHAWPPRNIVVLDSILSVSLLSGFRLLLRLWRERSDTDDEEAVLGTPGVRVGIIGAGTMGAELARELKLDRHLGRRVVAFFDDDVQKWHKHIHEIPVVGMPECLLEGWAQQLDEVVLALPNADSERVRELFRMLRRTQLKIYTARPRVNFRRPPLGRPATVGI